ncbi:MAG TPA: hypothetical protein GXX33_09620 [Firmicutes bacterium]|uniref:Uncharacterized protein n=1 Tax=Capillibacterium thermochitinicola TaxID=2699427 RepID=A0A8J6LIN9_9FIRM|nr:hypothetical protein [Capillibacterium thermochitinicola]MBA2133250.1 hypothetical protein [Capillibacterium thermochitinicola]HHW13242.1 hypothetical protein [Bacillota bacterium]
MKFNFKFERDGNYYFGLLLLVAASASIIYAFFFDGFEPQNFLAYFLIYAWGYTLLLKSDCEYRLKRLEEAVTALQNRLDRLDTDFSQETEVHIGESTEAESIAEEGETEEASAEENTPDRPAELNEDGEEGG